ncbi:transposase [Aeropyrum pernix]|uniref:Transposase n=1 Tax=Aeropyrum pernix TaxID=56636 RepID=A0A401HBI2_AERPX|nr:IS200/IS605 family accessory protein TnpB-related protein [Aeropyrum pernix]GBF09806.1 transposase [Aeropyrum pernix]
MARVTRTAIVRSVKLPRKAFRVFVELEGMYRNMVEQLTMYAVGNSIKSFTRLRALKYREMRKLYPQLPSHYVYTACQDASIRAKSFLRLKKRGLAEKDYPEIRSVSIWLDDHLWKASGLTSIRIATHKGWVELGLEPHKQYWRYINRGWRLASEARVKLDKRNRQLIIYLAFVKEAEEYKPRGYLPVDVNENSLAMLVDGIAYLFETDMKRLVLGYYYSRKRIQEKYDKLYGVKSRIGRRVLRKLKEREKKSDIRRKIANIVVRAAYEKRHAVVLEKLGRRPADSMAERIRDKQLRHRIYQASFRGIQKAIEEKARELGVPVVYVNPKNTSRTCPLHNAKIIYVNGSRVGRCSRGGELWHRDVAACWNLLLRARLGDGSHAPSPGGHLVLDVRAVPLPSNATHEPIGISKSLWARWNSLPQIQNATVLNRMEAVGRNGVKR